MVIDSSGNGGTRCLHLPPAAHAAACPDRRPPEASAGGGTPERMHCYRTDSMLDAAALTRNAPIARLL